MTLPDATRYYIDGAWVAPEAPRYDDIVNPATGEAFAQIALGNEADVNKAVAAARAAFPSFSKMPLKDRKDLIAAINDELIKRNDEIADAISIAMGAPMGLARMAQAPSGPQHFGQILKEIDSYEFEEWLGTTKVRHEPIGVCALITPWNWPMNQIATKVAPALAAGCTMVLKPSEKAPLDAVILADIMDKVGVPKGVFNLVHGDGPGVGSAMVSHEDVDMVSFTGSTRAGIAISEAAAKTVKRVSLELGGKSAAIILPSAPLERAITTCVREVMMNSGQSCNARTRVLVPKDKFEAAAKVAVTVAESLKVGDPKGDADLGPISNKDQYGKVVGLIQKGIEEGAPLLTGGPDMPKDRNQGYFVAPTVFGPVTPDMTIAREEIFGPVISMMTYDTLDEAIAVANDSEYGLSGAVWAETRAEAEEVAKELRTGMVHINGAGLDAAAPFGGFKMSGNGREWGKYGLEEYLELKAIYGARD
ncbi:aldehyde dehydrogenase family protein [Kordiimonas marina]|uniref:aldehyde dehydrogenase family protein n=1 Tax=Kordiimonas marina TaxID=2872312 RepID=UPI001FF276C5|nr:aldehyde dehydrogenase family protein [Kordiimonas marina]MCJ9427958.1 aldehyde dehydrogenase family protein [Kordiimonas marina]